MGVSTDSTGGFTVASSMTRMSVQWSYAHLRQREFVAERPPAKVASTEGGVQVRRVPPEAV